MRYGKSSLVFMQRRKEISTQVAEACQDGATPSLPQTDTRDQMLHI